MEIIPRHDGRGLLSINGEGIGSYHSAESAEDDVYTQHTGYEAWDDAIAPAPDGLQDWQMQV